MLLLTRRLCRLEIQFPWGTMVEENVYSITEEVDGHTTVSTTNSTLQNPTKPEVLPTRIGCLMLDHVKR